MPNMPIANTSTLHLLKKTSILISVCNFAQLVRLALFCRSKLWVCATSVQFQNYQVLQNS